MTTTLEPGVHVPAPARPAPASGPQPTTSDAPATASETPTDASPTGTRKVSRRTKLILIGFGVAGSILIGTIGFLLSFDNLTAAGARWGFGDRSTWFAIGVDTSILTFLVVDLILVIFDVRWGVPRFLAHLMTGATVFFNATAHGSPFDHPVRSLAHGLMPIFFVAGIEAGRKLLVKEAALERGRAYDPIPIDRWALAPWPTYKLWRRMKLWELRSYEKAIKIERDRAIYDVWLQHRQEVEAGHKDGQVGALDRLPMTMKRFGLSVEEALALPGEMRRADQERKQKAAAASLQLTLEKEKADAAAEKERIVVQGEIAAVRAEVRAATGIAEARADAAETDARTQAALAERAGTRAVTEAERTAALEAAAEETATVAEAKARTAEAERATAEAARLTAEEKRRTAEAEHGASEAAARAAEVDRLTALKEEATAKATASTETLKATAAEARRRASEAETAALEAEDRAKLSPRERTIHKTARLILTEAGGVAEQLELQRVMDVFNVALGTASGYRAEAAQLISGGYRG